MTNDLGPEVPHVEGGARLACPWLDTAALMSKPNTRDGWLRRRSRSAGDRGWCPAVEFDRLVEASDACHRVRAHGKVSAVEDRSDSEDVVEERGPRRRDQDVVGPEQRAAGGVPVLETVRPRDTDKLIASLKSVLDALEPVNGCSTVRVEIRQDLAACGTSSGFARHDEPLYRLLQHAYAGNGPRH